MCYEAAGGLSHSPTLYVATTHALGPSMWVGLPCPHTHGGQGSCSLLPDAQWWPLRVPSKMQGKGGPGMPALLILPLVETLPQGSHRNAGRGGLEAPAASWAVPALWKD